MTAADLEIHMRTDANSLVTTAKTTHVPEQEETIHMIQMLHHESCSGVIEDLAHTETKHMKADCMTKESAAPDNLIQAANSGILPKADEHPMFRELMRSRHKAFLVDYLVSVCKDADQIETCMAEDIRSDVKSYFAHSNFLRSC